jgi:hypothetical protein
MKNSKITELDSLTNKMNVQFDVFCALVMNRVSRHVLRRDIVAVGDGGLGGRALELAEQLTKPDALSCCVGDSAVFSFGTGARHHGLAL